MPDDNLLKHGIAAADIPQAKACAIRAIMADIPDDAAAHIDRMISRNPPARDDVVDQWLLNIGAANTDRHRQIMARVEQYCPEFQKAFAAP